MTDLAPRSPHEIGADLRMRFIETLELLRSTLDENATLKEKMSALEVLLFLLYLFFSYFVGSNCACTV